MYNISNIDSLELRMLGYYNKDGQFLKEEWEEIEFAKELAMRLKKSFDKIGEVNDDKEFDDAIKTGVIILRDKQYNLYAYWHKENIARVTDVIYNNTAITILPLEYKMWFVPGEEILIREKEVATGKSQKTLFEYLTLTDKIGKIISFKADFLEKEILGELQFAGKDFLSIKGKDSNVYCVSKHLCIKIHENSSFKNIVDDEYIDSSIDNDKELHPMGEFTNYDRFDRCWIKDNNGESVNCAQEEVLVEAKLKPGCKVVYSIRNNKITSVHPVSTISECLKLAKELYSNKSKSRAAKDVLDHILNDYPQNEDARESKVEIENEMKITQEENLRISQDFKKAEEQAKNPETIRDAIVEFSEILKKDRRVRDCILRISDCYVKLIENSSGDEDKRILCQEFKKFIEKEHVRLSMTQSRMIRLRYFNKLGMLPELKEVIDNALSGSQIDDKTRARLLYYKADLCNKNNEKVKALSCAKESLYLSPFDNPAELMPELMQKFNYNIDVQTIIPPMEDFPKNLIRYSDCKNKENKEKYFVDYFAKLARNLPQSDAGMSSALYLWNMIFGLINNFGYFIQYNLTFALSRILEVSINEDETIHFAPDWENKKSWKKIIEDCETISEEQLERIYYVVKDNKVIVREIENILEKSGKLNNYNKIPINSKIELGELCKDLGSEVIKEASNSLRNIYENKKTLLEFYEAFKDFKYNDSPFRDLVVRDSKILKELYEKCIENIKILVRENKLNKKKEIAEIINASLQKIAETIISCPTEFGVDGILGVVAWLQDQLVKIKEMPLKPRISIEIGERNLKKDSEGFYYVSATADNEEGSLDATNILFELSSNDIQESVKIKAAKLKEGSRMSFSFKIKPKLDIDTKSSLKFKIICSYNTKNENRIHKQSLKDLQVYLSDIQFVKIDKSPYFGTIVKYGDPTFVGRKTEMSDIIDKVLSENTKQIILYGQKRCGKTTLVNAIQKRLNESNHSAFCVNITYDDSNDELGFYKSILDEFKKRLDEYLDKTEGLQITEVPVLNMPTFDNSNENYENFRRFKNCIRDFKKSMQKTKGWENKKIILILDEFTKLFKGIRDEKISYDILNRWKVLQEDSETCFSTVFVGHDVVPILINNDPRIGNATSIIEKTQLTYLDKDSARELIIKPIMLPNGESRFDEDAIERIFYYTSRSPWYLQKFMDRMVMHINEKQIVKVFKMDVDEVAKKMLDKECGTLGRNDFDNLINSGLHDSEYDKKDEEAESVLKAIALGSVDTEWCKVSSIYEHEKLSLSEKEVEEILKDLDTRKIIGYNESEQIVKIKVGLFKEWLRN